MLLAGKCVNHCFNDSVCFSTHLVIGCILNWMRDEDPLSIYHTKCFGLSFSSIDKFFRGNRNCRNAVNFEPYRIVQTARGTGSSISQGFYDEIIAGADFLS